MHKNNTSFKNSLQGFWKKKPPLTSEDASRGKEVIDECSCAIDPAKMSKTLQVFGIENHCAIFNGTFLPAFLKSWRSIDECEDSY